jgi:hypothetical protein
METMWAPCSRCISKTKHNVLHSAQQTDEDYLYGYHLIGGVAGVRWLAPLFTGRTATEVLNTILPQYHEKCPRGPG